MIILREHEAFTASSSATTSIQLHTPSSVAAAHPVFPSDHTAHTFPSQPAHLAHCFAQKQSTACTQPQHSWHEHARWSEVLKQHAEHIAIDVLSL